MLDHDKLQLREPIMTPTRELLVLVLGDSYAAYEALQDALPGLGIVQEWQWYTPYKAWFARGQHSWTTPRGAKKEKNLYWLYVFEGYFSVAVWFKEKDRMDVLKADVSDETRQLVLDSKAKGKLTTFPAVFDITTAEPLADVYALIERKKELEK